ncbi:unnamed protein product [Thelazia callipaeda]|uniref:DRIM domain-containing protein n=1 Tax=Thelazia callipaeda TaxID=103827 RepID=A0A0N5CVF9_THECL|nr:unnamed protein product [Thelazia callipaeda]
MQSLRSTLLIATKLSPTLTDDQQRFLFRICITSALLARLAMDNLAFIQPHLVKRIRNLRVLSCNAFKEVFHASQDRHFVIDELNSFITYIVTPQCLYVDGNAVPEIPLSLLRLFLSWTSIPKLFFLLRLQVVTDGKAPCSLLSILCNMLSSKSISNLSKEKIIDGIFDLLTLADEITTYAVPDNILFPLPEQHGLSSGFAMVISELPKILAFIFASLPSEREKRKLKTKHLELLSRVSDFIQDGEMIEQYISVLLTFVNSGTIRSDDVIRSLLLIVSRMMAATPEPIKFLKQLVNPQSSLTERSHREALQKVEEVIAVRIKENDKRKAELLNYIISFDSWDASRIGEPDYDERHNAYSGFSEALTSNEVIDPVILCLALHNDYYVITQFSDISLRSGATRNFRNIIEYFEKFQMVECDNNEATIFIILKLIVKGLSIEKELIRHDFVKLLVAMITCFPMHKHLRFLLPLRNTADIDLDFFENIIHLQIHRRQRALYKLTQSLRTEEVHIPNEILHQFVLPLFKPYLSNLSSSTSALSDAALGLLKQIMSRTPWKKYFSMLNYYLKRLKKEDTNDKSLVRIIVAIVEAFHFNVWDEAHNPALKQKSVHFKINETGNISSNSKEDSQVEDLIVAQVNSNSSLRSSASCIYQKIVEYLIPQLKDCATGKDLTSHRKAHSLKYYKEDDEIRRAPVALATVKLLQKMPQKVMDDNLHGKLSRIAARVYHYSVVIKMCSLLMSRSVSVREAAGKTVIEITKTLGSKYICFIIREMKQTMTKGYQIHVMIFYIHKLLSAMEFQLSTGDLDSCLIDIVEVCNMDLFGDIADEKSVSGITKDVPEAKTQRTYETYRLLGRYISSNCLDYVLETLKKVVESRPDTKTMQKVGRLLRQYSLGISANEGIESKVALVFAYHILKSEVLGVMKEGEKPTESGASETKKRRRAESCLLLEKEPGRMGVIVKVSTRSKMHVFIEFGMCELYSVLKNKAFDVDSNNDIARLDPFVNIVLQCLHLKYDQILVYSLRCFLILLKFPLPSLRSNIAEFLNRLFILLADYAAIGAFGSAHEYVRKSSESLTQIIRDAPHLVLISKRLQLLLTYVETDVADNQKQAVAFPLIKAIITRKLQDPKIPEIIHYLSEISIMSEISHIREQCRQVILQYVGTHPQSKKPAKYIEFFLEQLEYQYEDGRRSAIEMLNMLFQKFTEKVNDEYALFAYVKLSARLMNDESKECRRMVSLAIQQLINSVSGSKRNDLYLATQDWLKSNKEIYICTAMQLLVMFSKDSGENIENTLRELSQTLSRIFDIDTSYSCAEENILIIIDNLTSLLRAYIGISSFASSQKSPLIQLSAAQFFGFIFAAVSDEYLLSMSDPSPRQLMQWMLSVMKSYELNNALAEQTAKNIVYLFDPVVRSGENLDWLVSRFKMICRFEIVRLPAEFTRRISIFKVIAAVVLKTDLNQCRIVIRSLLPVLYREMQGRSTQTSEELRRIALEVVETIKRKIGEDEFTKRITECHRQFDIRSQMRKRKRKEDFVLNPVNAALKKQRKNKVKQKLKAKKRRIS